MRILAARVAAGTCSNVERGELDRQLADRRTEIDGIATAARFRGIGLLCGGTRIEEVAERATGAHFSAIELGFHLRHGAGVAALLLETNTPTIEAGDRIRIEYRSADQRFAVTNTATGHTAHAGPPRGGHAPGETMVVEVPEFGLTLHLNDAFDPGRDNMAAPGSAETNEFRVGMMSRTTRRTVVINALELEFQVGWRGGDRDRIALRLPSARVAELDRDLPTASVSTVRGARCCLAVVRRAAHELTRIGAYLDTMEAVFDDAIERLTAGTECAHAPDREKVATLAKAALARAALGRVGRSGGRAGQGGFLAARSIPAMRHLLLDLAPTGRGASSHMPGSPRSAASPAAS